MGYNQNTDVSDTLSCTSGYSMYTNEGSTFSGFNNPNSQYDQNVINNLQQNNRSITNTQNILNSNQMVNNYTTMQNTAQTVNQPNIHSSSNNYQIQSSSNELPFIQRLHNTMHMNSSSNLTGNNTSNNTNNFEGFPRINLQVPSMLSPGEVAMINGINPYNEPNIDIYVHTLVAPSNIQLNQGNTGTSNTNSISTNTNNNLMSNTLLTNNNSNSNIFAGNNLEQSPNSIGNITNIPTNTRDNRSNSGIFSRGGNHGVTADYHTGNYASQHMQGLQGLHGSINSENLGHNNHQSSETTNSGGGIINGLLGSLVNVFTGKKIYLIV